MGIELTKEEVKKARERFENYKVYRELYETNKEFKDFVDKNCKTYDIPYVQLCLLMKTVQEVGDYYMHKDDDKVDICPCEGIELEDKSC